MVEEKKKKKQPNQPGKFDRAAAGLTKKSGTRSFETAKGKKSTKKSEFEKDKRTERKAEQDKKITEKPKEEIIQQDTPQQTQIIEPKKELPLGANLIGGIRDAGQVTGAENIQTAFGELPFTQKEAALGTGAALAIAGPPVAAAAGLIGVGTAAAGVLSAIYGVDKFLLSPSELGTWTAIDNVAGQASFLATKITNDVKFNNYPIDQAFQQINESRETIKEARNFVVSTTSKNPKLWANAKMYSLALDQADLSLNFSLESINNFKGGQTND